MDLPDIKQLKKLALACKKLGILYIKTPTLELEFNSTNTPNKTKRALKLNPTKVVEDIITQNEDELTPEQLLLWSTQDPITIGSDEGIA